MNDKQMTRAPSFDGIARPYRWLEYLILGRALERTRTHFLPRLSDRRHALILGDGDGRFTATLLAQNPTLQADAVDLSASMLALTRQRTASLRLHTHHADARAFTPPHPPDLVVTHFFLDCLTQPETAALAARLAPALAPQALWLVSDFRIPPGPLHWPARALIRLLYLAFRLLTGLRTTHLPDHAAALTAAGFHRLAHHHSLAGLLATELWQRPQSNIYELKAPSS
jgi:SAM-dependent methyltransferase